MNRFRTNSRARIQSGPEMPNYLIVQNPDDVADTMSTLQFASNTTPPGQTELERRQERLNELRTRYEQYALHTDNLLDPHQDEGFNLVRVVLFRTPRELYMQRLIRQAQQALSEIPEASAEVESPHVEVESRQEELR